MAKSWAAKELVGLYKGDTSVSANLGANMEINSRLLRIVMREFAENMRSTSIHLILYELAKVLLPVDGDQRNDLIGKVCSVAENWANGLCMKTTRICQVAIAA